MNLKKTFSLAFIFVVLLISIQAQGIDYDAQLPIDETLIYGKLDNGLTYYIKKNTEPANHAEFRLVNNIGSVLENENQRGLAHFTEHLAFNGSENFPGNALIDYLSSIGQGYHAGLNAYTGFDKTVYMLQAKTNDKEQLEKSFVILSDWASKVSFTDEAIDKERGIIMEEWRLRGGYSERMFEKHKEAYFGDSQYANRMPIGLPDVIQNFKYDTIREFYKDWYRPDLQAIVAVGDFDVVEIENYIKQYFDNIPKRNNPRQRPSFTVPPNKEPIISIMTDPEVPFCLIQVLNKRPAFVIKTHEDFKTFLKSEILITMINKRFEEIAHSVDAPFISGGSGDQQLIQTASSFHFVAFADPENILNAVEGVFREMNRIDQQGFNMSEFILAKQTLLMEFEKEVQEKDKTHSRKIASEYIDHFLGESEIMDVEYRFELAQELFDEISIDDVMDLFDVYVTEENRSIMITIPETEGLILPEKDDILAIMIEMEETEHDPYNEMEVPDELLTKKPKKVSVKKPVLDKALDVHIWTLANGAKVYLKTTDFKNDEIVFRVIRRGGDSHADDNIIHSVNVATMVAEEGGLGSIDKMTLNAFLMPKDIRFNRTIDENSELLSGSSSVKDFETLMQMIYLNATDVRYDEQAFLIWKNNLKSMIKNQINNPEYNLQVQWQKLLYNDNIRKNPDLNEYIDNVDYKTAYDYYVSRFNSANDFHFMFVGNIKPNELQPFIEQYIATIPNKKTSSKVIDRGVRYNQSLQTKEIFKGLEPKSMTFISFTNDYTVKDRLVEIAQSAVASLVFNEMLRESVRETMSGVYVIQAFNDVDIIPYSQLVTHIVFGSDPDKVDEIIHEIDNQIEILKAGTFDEKYFVSAIETMRKNLDNSIKTNNYLMGRLIHNYVNKYKLHDNYKLYDNITIKDVADFATKNIDMNKRLTVILLPESYENIELEEAVGF